MEVKSVKNAKYIKLRVIISKCANINSDYEICRDLMNKRCPVCGREFLTMRGLKTHIKKSRNCWASFKSQSYQIYYRLKKLEDAVVNAYALL